MSLVISYRNWAKVPDTVLRFTPGLNLLQGVSGRGKSSSLAALTFALTGACKYKTPPTRGAACVEVWFEPPLAQTRLYIRRQKKPERLHVQTPDRVYESVDAQLIIDAAIGTSQQYLLSMILHQRKPNELLQASAGDRIGLLENILGQVVPIDAWLAKLATQKQQYATQLEVIKTTHLIRTPTPPVPPADAVQLSPAAIMALLAENETLEKQIADETPELHHETERAKYLSVLKTELAAIVIPASPVTAADVLSHRQTTLITAIRQHAHLIKRVDITAALTELDLPARYPQAVLDAAQRYLDQTANLTQTLSVLGDPTIRLQDYPAYSTMLTQYQATERARYAYDQYQYQLKQLEAQLASQPAIQENLILHEHIQSVLAEQVNQCPACGVKLTFGPTGLTQVTGPIHTRAELQQRETTRQAILAQARQRQELETRLATMKQYQPPTPETLPTLPFPLEKLQHIVRILQPFSTGAPTPPAVVLTQGDLEKHYKALKYEAMLVGLPSGIPGDLPTLQAELIAVEADIKHHEAHKQAVSKRALLEHHLASIPPIDPDRPDRLKQARTRVDIITRQLDLSDQCVVYATHQRETQQSQAAIASFNEHIEAIGILEGEIVMAEYMYIEQLLDNINGLLAIIIERLFDEPIHVRISAFRPVKSGHRVKPQIHLHIEHNGFEVDNINDVSIGMSDRISLALTLVLSRLMGKTFIALDEVGSALDPVAKESMFETIKEYGPPLVVMTQHDEHEGVFDTIVRLGNIETLV